MERWFFRALTTTRHLGLLNDTRLALSTAGFYPGDARWRAMVLTLSGDREMLVWRQPPARAWPVIGLYVDSSREAARVQRFRLDRSHAAPAKGAFV